MAISGGDGSIILDTKVDTKGLNSGLNSMKGAITKIGGLLATAFSVKMLTNFVKESRNLYKIQMENEVKLATVMRQRMKATDDEIKSVLELASAQQQIGIIGDEVQLAGLQQIATFAKNKESIEALLPAMNNLIAQQYGFEASTESARNVANLMGKALQGQVGALTRVGITFDATEEAMLKTGNEMERAAALAQIITNNVGEMNTALAQTDVGRQQQLANTWGDIKEQFGAAFQQIAIIALPVLNAVAKALAWVANIARMAAQTIANMFGMKTSGGGGTQNTGIGGLSTSTEQAADGMKNLGNATEKAGKQAKKSTASFDDLEILTENAASSAGKAAEQMGDVAAGIGGDVGTGFDFGIQAEVETLTPLQKALEDLQSAFSGIKDIDLTNLTNSLALLKEPLKGLAEIGWDVLLWGIENVIVPLTEFTVEEVLPRFFETLSKALRLFKTILDEGFEIYKQFYDEFLKPIASYAADGFLQLWDTLNENLEEFVTIVENSTAWQDLQTILGLIYDVLEPVVKWIIDFVVWVGKLTINKAWTDLKWRFLDIEDALGLIADIINGDFGGAWEHLKDLMWDNRIDKAKENLDNLRTAFDDVKTKVEEFVEDWKLKIDDMVEIWKTKISAWWTDNVEPWFTIEKWSEVFSHIGTSLANFLVGAGGFVETWKSNITNWWNDDVSPWFTTDKWKKVFDNIVTSISNFFTAEDGFVKTWKTKISKWWTDEVEPWFTVEKWKELGTNIKDGLIDGVNGAINGIRGVINKILDGFQGLVNGAIDMLNSLISGWNKVADVTPGLPSISSIKRVNLSKYKLPMLAQGAVIPPNREFLAVLGDQKNGTNIEAPADLIKQKVMEAMIEMGGNFGGGNTEVVLEIDGREFGRAVVEQGNRENRRIGTRLVIA